VASTACELARIGSDRASFVLRSSPVNAGLYFLRYSTIYHSASCFGIPGEFIIAKKTSPIAIAYRATRRPRQDVMRYLKNIPLATALGPAVEVIVIVTWPEIFQIR
jgi:hypothetical protein